MSDREKRVEELERGRGGGPQVLVHAFPRQSSADAIARHVRKYGPLPSGAEVVVIHHPFISPLSHYPEDEDDWNSLPPEYRARRV